MNLKSSQLEIIQDALDRIMKIEISKPNTDYESIEAMASVAGVIDNERRLKWNGEHFGVYDEIADSFFDKKDELMKANFTMDDIPF